MAMINALELTKELIRRPSLTPDDAGCQAYLAEILTTLGFTLHWMPSKGVSNLWAVYGSEGPLFCFAGHTDVVPVGDLKNWTFPPFEPTLFEEKLYGRGAADMKSGLAAMVTATATFLKRAARKTARVLSCQSYKNVAKPFNTASSENLLVSISLGIPFVLVEEEP